MPGLLDFPAPLPGLMGAQQNNLGMQSPELMRLLEFYRQMMQQQAHQPMPSGSAYNTWTGVRG